MNEETANQIIEILVEKINDLEMEIERLHDKNKHFEHVIVELSKSCITERQVY